MMTDGLAHGQGRAWLELGLSRAGNTHSRCAAKEGGGV